MLSDSVTEESGRDQQNNVETEREEEEGNVVDEEAEDTQSDHGVIHKQSEELSKAGSSDYAQHKHHHEKKRLVS